eukprot:UN24901
MQVYRLTQEYAIDNPAKGKCRLWFPLVNGHLYYNNFSVMWQLFDNNKKYISSGDEYDMHEIDLKKQNGYVLRIKAESEKYAQLENLKKMRLVKDMHVDSMSCDIYRKRQHIATKENKIGDKGTSLPKGNHKWIFIGEPDAKKVPTYAKPGDQLVGIFTLEKKSATRKTYHFKERPGGDGQRSYCAQVIYTVPQKIEEAKKKDDSKKSEDLLENYIPLRIKAIQDLPEKLLLEAFKMDEPLFEKVQKGSLSHLRLLQLKLDLTDKEKKD